MPDREKVIKGLECCSAVPEHDCENCPYDQETGDYICGSREMKREAIELLKEQEAVVRCRDCKHHDDDFPCELHTIDGSANDEWFCADGEQKE